MKNNLVKVILLTLTLFLTAAGQMAVVWLPIAKAAGPVEEKKSLAPNFKLKDLDQISMELSGFKNKSPVVLFFWTTWCPYCQTALKNLSQTMPVLEKEGIAVLSINSGEPSAKVAKFAKNKGYTFRIFLDSDSKVTDAYHIYGVPTYFLVDKNGYVRSVSNAFPHDEARKLAKE